MFLNFGRLNLKIFKCGGIGALLVAHDGLLDGGERLEWRQEAVHVLRPANQRREGAKLLRQGQQHL